MKTIEQLAREADFKVKNFKSPVITAKHSNGSWVSVGDELQRFATLVIEQEHARLLVGAGEPQKIEKTDQYGDAYAYTADQLAAAVLRERDAMRAELEATKAEPVAWLIKYEYCAGGMNRNGSSKKFDHVWLPSSFVSEDKDADIDAVQWRNKKVIPLFTHPAPKAEPVNQMPPQEFKVISAYTPDMDAVRRAEKEKGEKFLAAINPAQPAELTCNTCLHCIQGTGGPHSFDADVCRECSNYWDSKHEYRALIAAQGAKTK